MIIKKIEIKNYRQYAGRQEINLGMSGRFNVNVFIGSTGVGKTNLSNAINWCFYGDEFSIEKNTKFPMLNKDVITNMEDGKIQDVSVAIHIDYEGENYVIKREKNFIKLKGGCELVPYQSSDDGSKFTITFLATKTKRKPSLSPDFPTTFINTIAPKKIREFFFFDGEKLKRYLHTGSGSEIRDSIFNISQLDLLEKTSNRLKRVIVDYRHNSRSFSPDKGVLEGEIKKLEEGVEELKNDIKTKEENKKKLEKEYQKFLDEYGNLGGDRTKALISEKKRLDEELEKDILKLDEITTEKRKLLISYSYIIVGKKAIDKAIKRLEDAERKKEIPPNVSPEYIEGLIKKGKSCICGRSIGAKEKVALTKLIKSIISMADANIATGTHNGLRNLKLKDIPILKRQLLDNNNKIKELDASIDKKRHYLKKIDSDMKSNNKEKLDSLYDMIERARVSIESTSNKITLRKKEKEENEILLSDKNKEYKKNLERDERGRVIAKYMTFTESAMKITEDIQKKIMDEIRIEIANQAQEHYKELHWKKNEDINIVIGDDYSISAIQGGDEKMGAFSAGEEALLAISLLIALNNVSGFKVPIVMDTMLGRIDEEPSHSFAMNIADYLKGTQLIFLFTKKEYSIDVRKGLDKYLCFKYRINLKNNNPLTAYFKAEVES